MQVRQAIQLYMERVRAERSATSQHTYQWARKCFVAAWGEDRDLGSITRKEMQDYINRRKEQIAPSTLRSEISFYRQLIAVALEAGHELTAHKLRLPRVNNRRERILTHEEQARLKKVMHPWDFSMIEFVLHTGLRRLELFRLKQKDIQLFKRGGRLLGMAKVVTSKTGRGRNCPLNPVAANIARVWLECRTCTWAFSRPKDDRYQEATWYDQQILRPALRLAGIEGFSFHGLRHTFATRALQGGARLEQISFALGHQTMEETLRYAHWDEEQVWPAVLAVAQ